MIFLSFLYLNQSDPDGTMSWLVRELYASEKSGDAVHVMAHIPPGDGECLEGWARNYYRVVQRLVYLEALLKVGKFILDSPIQSPRNTSATITTISSSFSMKTWTM